MNTDGSRIVNGEKDPFDILGEYDPIDPETSPTADSAEGRAMFERIVEETRPPTARPSPRRRLTPRVALGLAAAVAVLAVATTFAFSLVVTTSGAACHATPSLDSDVFVLAVTDSAGADVCEYPWVEGLFELPGLTLGEVPPLTACVNDSGTLAVFPTGDAGICADLGLASASPSQPEERIATVSKAVDAIDLFIAEVPCRPLDEAAEGARRILDEHGLNDWRVVIGASTAGRPCASIALDTPGTTIVIVPIPQP